MDVQSRLQLISILVALSVLPAMSFPINELKIEAERLRNLYELALEQKYQKQAQDQKDLLAKPNAESMNYGHNKQVSSDGDGEMASIMGLVAPSPTKAPETNCLNNGSLNAPNMTIDDLQKMINTVEIVFGTQTTLKTYLAVDYGATIYAEYEPLLALIQLFALYENPQNPLPKPDTLWMTRSPCPACAKRIIGDYQKASVKPTIYVASFYTGDNLVETVESLKCLAKLIHLNYTVLAWNWNELRDNLHNENCQNTINTALQTTGFPLKQQELITVLQFADELSKLPDIDSWCPVTIHD